MIAKNYYYFQEYLYLKLYQRYFGDILQRNKCKYYKIYFHLTDLVETTNYVLHKFFYHKTDKLWNLFDFTVVMLGVFDLWLLEATAQNLTLSALCQ